MLDAEQILVLGHRGLLGQALLKVCQGRCQMIAGGCEAFDLARQLLGPTPVDGSGQP